MTPGVMHAVYTPVPSIFTGSSFWVWEAMHLTRMSRKSDHLEGGSLTNVDHNVNMVYKSLVRIALGVPFVECNGMSHCFIGIQSLMSPNLSIWCLALRSSIVALCDMLVNPIDYIPQGKSASLESLHRPKLSQLAIRTLEELISVHDQTMELQKGLEDARIEEKGGIWTTARARDAMRYASRTRAQEQDESPVWFLSSPQASKIDYNSLREAVQRLARAVGLKY